MPTGLEIWSRPSPVTSSPSARRCPASRATSARATRRPPRAAAAARRRGRSESICALVEARRRRRQRHGRRRCGRRRRSAVPRRTLDQPRTALPDLLALDRHDAVAGPEGPSSRRATGSVTCSTVVVAFPEVMKRNVKSTSASTMFAAGPAAIAATRFQVGARQYAVGPSASSMSSRLLRADVATCGDSAVSSSSPRNTRTASRPCRGRRRRSPPEPARGAGEDGALRRAPVRDPCRRPPVPVCACRGSSMKPPSGIAPSPYSIPFRVVFHTAGGNPM